MPPAPTRRIPLWIVDLDGTLALGHFDVVGRRGPFDWDRVGEDDPNLPMISVVNALTATGAMIVVMTGRSEICRPQTVDWLRRHGVPFVDLLMRADGDYRPDQTVKAEMYDRRIRQDLYGVVGVFDDRDAVVHMWRSKGLFCAQVAYGAF